jgi:hypothetical protein
LERIDKIVFKGTCLITLAIPGSVVVLGDECFLGCISLVCVTFEKPSRLERIEKHAFVGTGLNQIVIPSSVLEIGDFAFSECRSLVSVTFQTPAKLKTIGKSAFHPTRIASIMIPSSVLILGEAIFEHLYSLGSVQFETNSHLQIISRRAFWHTSLRSIVIPKSVTVISSESFSGRREEQVWMDVWEERPWSDIASITFEHPSNLERIEDGAFKRAQLKSLVIPSSVRYLGAECFSDCKLIESLTFEANSHLEEIGASAFKSIRISSLSIPASVRVLGACCFLDTGQLQSVKFDPRCRLEQLGDGAFSLCGLRLLILPSALPSLNGSFADCDSESVVVAGDCCRYQIVNLLLMDTSVSTLYRYFGKGKFVVIPASVSVIGAGCFRFLGHLASIEFEPNSRLERIEGKAFSQAHIYSIVLPPSVTVVCELAFATSRLESICVPSECVLERGCFYWCSERLSVRRDDGPPRLAERCHLYSCDPVSKSFPFADCR